MIYISYFMLFVFLLVGCVPEQQHVSTKENLLEKARMLAIDGEYDKAIITYQMVAVDDITSDRVPLALYEVGRIQFFYLNKPVDALETLRHVADEYPEYEKASRARFLAGNIIEEFFSKYRNAIEEYGKLIRSYPGSALAVESQYRIAQCYYKLRDYFQAVTEFEEVLEKSDNHFVDASLYRMGDIYYLTGNYSKALGHYQKLLNKFPESLYARDTRFYIARCYEALLEFDTALSEYKALVKISHGVDVKIAEKAILRIGKKKKKERERQKSRLNPRRRKR